MSIWTEYNNRTPAGVAGGLYDLTDHAELDLSVRSVDAE